MLGDDLTIRRAVALLALITLSVAIAAGLVMRMLDYEDFPTAGAGLWWAAQTITTVGYGDKIPTTVEGQLLAVLVMVTGLGFMSVVTAAITAAFVESARRRRRVPDEITLHRIAERLDRIEAELVHQRLEADQRDPDQPDGGAMQEGAPPGGPG